MAEHPARFNRVLLLTRYNTAERYVASLASGIGYVAEALRQAGVGYRVFDYNLDPRVRTLKQVVADYRPDLIAAGMMSVDYYDGYQLLIELKQTYPWIPLLVGGPHASAFREQVLHECCYIDYVAVREAEQTLVELCRGLELEQIKGLIYRDPRHGVRYTGDRAPQRDLDRVPFPTFRGFDTARYPYLCRHIVTSRGCPHRCIFCPVRPSMGRAVRVRSANDVVDEIEFWARRGVFEFHVGDDHFTVYRRRVLQICDEIQRRGIDVRLNLTNGLRADRVDRELLQRMREVGFDEIAFGVESANDDILQRIKKGERLETIERAIGIACSLGFDVSLYFLVGLPGETEDHVRRSFAFAQRYPVGSAYFYNIVPFPGTELAEYLVRQQLLLKPLNQAVNAASHWSNEPLFATPELGLERRRALLLEGRAITQRLRRRRLARRLRAFGPLASLTARTLSIPAVENVLMTTPSLVRFYVRAKQRFYR